jgi:dienelactone hydrolase
MLRKSLLSALFVSLFIVSGCKISGTISDDGTALEGITVTLSGDMSMSATTDREGAYAFKSLKPGNYTVTPSFAGYTFHPARYTISLGIEDINGFTDANFTVVSVEVPPEASPEETGPYHVGYYETTYTIEPFGTYKAVIRYPAYSDRLRAPKDSRGAPYPGIVVCNGLYGEEWQISWIPEHLTSHGYATICFSPPDAALFDITQWAEGFRGGISRLQGENSLNNSPVYGLVDSEKIGALGFSMGGGGCIEAGGTPHSEIDVAVALAPAGFSSEEETETMAAARNLTIPIQLQVGSNDGMVAPARVQPFYETLIPGDTIKEYVEINGGNHIGNLDETYAEIATWLGLDNPNTIGFEEQRRIAGKYFTAWFQYYLKGLQSYHTYIFGTEAENDFHTGILSDLRYNVP